MMKDAKDNPQLLGLLLIGSGTAIKQFFPQYDFVIFDFSGGHVAPASVSKATAAASASGQSKPSWISDIENALGIIFDPVAALQGQPTAFSSGLSALSSTLTGSVPNLLHLLGINLPAKITLSEALTIGGILAMATPLLSSLSGSASSLLSKLPIMLG